MTEAQIASERTSVEDRLTVMIVLAGLLHLILILGITFAAPERGYDGAIRTLEVLLVGDDLPESPANDEAQYLSQRTQEGAGNAEVDSRSRMPASANAPFDRPGELQGRGALDAAAGPTGGDPEAVMAQTDDARMRFAADAHTAAERAPDAPRQLIAGAETTLPSIEDDPELSLKGPARRELIVTPSTRESGIAVYLDAWKRKVERVGTLNFPNQARRRAMSGNPVLEVVLASDGRLTEARVRRTSGFPELDQAALEILRLAAPFEPFSRELADRHDSLRFAYEWQFEGGQLTGSSVRMPAGGR
jgi:protein TonB